MAYMEETTRITLLIFFFFCNKLKALFTTSINCHTVRIYGGEGRESWTTHVVLKVRRIIEPNGKAYSQIQYIFKLDFKHNDF